MPVAIIAGIPPDVDRRIKEALKRAGRLFPDWHVDWVRAPGRIPGVAPSQLDPILQLAAGAGGAHVLVFRGRERTEEELVSTSIAPYFRMRWLSHTILKLIPHATDRFFAQIERALDEELEWSKTVKPEDESCCLLLPECCFQADAAVGHIWKAAAEVSIERIRLAAKAVEKFKDVHWLPHSPGSRASAVRKWIDVGGKAFDHRGARHGVAPFPRPWRFSYQVVPGFHFDVTSRDGRGTYVTDYDGARHAVKGSGHINVDSHGHVRG